MHTWSRPFLMPPQRSIMYKTRPPTAQSAFNGEAKCGNALVILTMSSQLSAGSPIYNQLSPLWLTNYLVGPDNLTANKDFKHVLKCQCNLLMCNKGVLILGFCITPTILQSQLKSHSVPSYQLHSLLNANNKQDVILAYSLLKENGHSLRHQLIQAWCSLKEALNVYRIFMCHLVLPYVSVDLNLDQQLVHLSGAAHTSLFTSTGTTWHVHNSCKLNPMPTLWSWSKMSFSVWPKSRSTILWVNSILFCLVLTAWKLLWLDSDSGQYWCKCQSSTAWRPCIRTHRDGCHSHGVPRMDTGTCCLTLPCTLGEITSSLDHITSKDWRGNTTVGRVNLHTCCLLAPGVSRSYWLSPWGRPCLQAAAGRGFCWRWHTVPTWYSIGEPAWWWWGWPWWLQSWAPRRLSPPFTCHRTCRQHTHIPFLYRWRWLGGCNGWWNASKQCPFKDHHTRPGNI